MRLLLTTAAIIFGCTTSAVFAQGFTQSYDHSIAVFRLAEEDRKVGRAVPVSLPLPIYPTEMLRAGIIGEATLRFVVKEDGAVTDVTVTHSSQSEFAAPAKEAVARWKFQTVSLRGVPTPLKISMTCVIVFKIEDK